MIGTSGWTLEVSAGVSPVTLAYVADTIDQAYVCCLTCRHGGHACHILPWFEGEEGVGGNSVCPVSGCDCNCADI